MRKTDLSIVGCLVVCVIFCARYIVFGENVVVPINDYYDSNVVWFYLISKNKIGFFDFDPSIPEMMGGLPRNCYGTDLSFIILLYLIFPVLIANCINEMIIHVVAFFGMYNLLVYILEKENKNQDIFCLPIAFSISFIYSIIDFWIPTGLSIAGLPLLLLCFLRIHDQKDQKNDWIYLILFPFYSTFYMSSLFLVAYLLIFAFIEIVRKQKLHKRFVFSIFLFVLVSMFVEYRIIYDMLYNKNFISHRVEFSRNLTNFEDSVKLTRLLIESDMFHVRSFHQELIILFIKISLLLIAILFIISLLQKRNLFGENKKNAYMILIIVSILLFNSIIYGFSNFERIVFIYDLIGILKVFQLRFYWLNPPLWYLCWFYCILFIKQSFESLDIKRFVKKSKFEEYWKISLNIIILIIISFQSLYIINNFNDARVQKLTYQQYVSRELFLRIKTDLGGASESYRIMCIGFHPAVAILNGFYTLDGYIANYPLEYKHKFREIIAKELEKSEEIRNYFDDWGSRCYAFSAELSSFPKYYKDSDAVITYLEYNLTAFENMGGKYLFSAVPILNYNYGELVLVNIFEDDISPYRIYVYGLRKNFNF